MNLKEIFPTADQLKLTRGIEADLLQRRRKGLIGGIVAVLAAVVQVLLVAIEKDYADKIGGAFRSVFKEPRTLIAVPEMIGIGVIVVGFAVYFTLRWTSLLAKESKEPFQYTFWIECFEETTGTPGTRFTLKAVDRLKLLNQDLMERLSLGIRRLSLLDAERDVPAEIRRSLTSHVQVRGSYAVREEKDGKWALEVAARIRIGPLGRPETLVDPVSAVLNEEPTDKTNKIEEFLSADRYNQLVERIYSKVATEIYKQILSDVRSKSELFPSSYLRAVALYHEAVDFERSKTIDAYDYAIKLYRESKRHFDIRVFGWFSRLLVTVPVVPLWRLVKGSVLADASARVGLARSLIYRSIVSALSGRNRNTLFEIPAEMDKVIVDLNRLQNRKSRKWKFQEPIYDGKASREPRALTTANRYRSLLGFLTYPNDSALRRDREDFDRERELLSTAFTVSALAYYNLEAPTKAGLLLASAMAAQPVFSQTSPVWLLTKAEGEFDVDQKLLFLRKATELDPDFEIAQYRLAQYSELKLRQRDEISKERIASLIKQYDEVLRINPGNIGALSAQGYLLWLAGDLDGAQKKLEEGRQTKAIVRQTFVGDLLYSLARIAAEKGQISRSYDQYTQAVSADPAVAAYSPTIGEKLLPSNYDYVSSSVVNRQKDFKASVEQTIQLLTTPSKKKTPLDTEGVDLTEKTIDAVHSFVLNDYGNVCLNYYRCIGDRSSLKNSIDAFEAAVEKDPQNVAAYYNLNAALGWSEDLSDSTIERITDCLDRAEKLAPAWPAVVIDSVGHRLRQKRLRVEMKNNEIKSLKIDLKKQVKEATLRPVDQELQAAPAGKEEDLKARLNMAEKDLRSHTNSLRDEIFPQIRTKVMERTKWSPMLDDLQMNYDGHGVKTFLENKIQRDRLDDDEISALEVWASGLANHAESREALQAAEKLFKYVQTFYPERFMTVLNLSAVYSSLMKLSLPASQVDES